MVNAPYQLRIAALVFAVMGAVVFGVGWFMTGSLAGALMGGAPLVAASAAVMTHAHRSDGRSSRQASAKVPLATFVVCLIVLYLPALLLR